MKKTFVILATAMALSVTGCDRIDKTAKEITPPPVESSSPQTKPEKNKTKPFAERLKENRPSSDEEALRQMGY